ncbi:MAG: DUF2158 domain-containing protein [Candidatus Riflebacteria bacterium HGW-Riflebacteria-1]|jgi:uncharacterized protein YodC (DUF2158 family)|nr:MAG: DUF2158 domain-containing protein [Candidatus Riflebacteria bacterium HGW-Riflebacteria-1]
MSKQIKFAIGDIVKLKSGGPDMTVKECITKNGSDKIEALKCQWFAGKKLDSGVFSLQSILKVEEE